MSTLIPTVTADSGKRDLTAKDNRYGVRMLSADTVAITIQRADPQMLGAIVRAARGLLRLSQNEFAGMAGVSRRTITKVESGASRIDFETSERLLQAVRGMGVTVELWDTEIGGGLPSRMDLQIGIDVEALPSSSDSEDLT